MTLTLFRNAKLLDPTVAELQDGVSVLVEGQWMHGQVAAHDGTGLVLEQVDGTHSVVRTERIAAVNVHSSSPFSSTPSYDDLDRVRPLVAAV